MKNRLLSLSFVLMTLAGVMSVQTASAQDKAVVRLAQEAESSSDWITATKNYKQLVLSNPDIPLYHSKLGYCYLQCNRRTDALSEFKKAEGLYTEKQKKKVPALTNEFYIGKTYRQSDSLDKALTLLKDLQGRAKGKQLKKDVAHEIELCNYAKTMKQNPKDILVLNLGAFVNSDEIEHTPIITDDQKNLYFTSRRRLEGHEKTDDGKFDENIYVSTLVDSTGTWSKPEPLPENVNTGEHIAVICLSPDGQELYIYSEEQNGSILVSKKEGDTWSDPEPLNEMINTDYRETGACLSADGKKLYFASSRPEGFGGLDIWVSTRENGGDWGMAENLGKTINTDQDEDGPFIADNGRLYFSSKGHNGLGGYDVFYSDPSSKSKDGWSEPVNAGYPINSNDDDIYMFVDSDGKSYLSSDRPKGIGAADLYVLGPTEMLKTDATIYKGEVTHCDSLPASIVLVRDNSTGESVEIVPDENGKFEILTYRTHNYSLSATTNDEVVFTDVFDVAANASDSLDYPTIKLDPGVECKVDTAMVAVVDPNEGRDGQIYDYVVEIHDIYFAFAKADKIETNEDLNKLADFLKANENTVVMINGYCDAAGRAITNVNLSRQRVERAVAYLKSKGVLPKQIKSQALGEENPQTYNFKDGQLFEDSKQYNRRIEFEVVQQGEKTLLIRHLNSIPEEYKNPNYIKNGYKKVYGRNPETTK